MRRASNFLLWLAVAAGAAIRLFGVNELALTHWDEGSYVAGPLHVGPYARGEPVCLYAPPLYPLLNRVALSLSGDDPRAAIVVAALLGIAGVLAVAAFARRAFGEMAGVVAAWIFAFDPMQVLHARMALTETTFTTLVLVESALLARAFATGRARDAALAGVVAGLATATKYHGGFPLVVAAVVAAVDIVRAQAETRGVLAVARLETLVVAGLSALPFVAWVAFDIHDTAGFARFAADRATWVNGLHAWTLRRTVVFVWESWSRFGAIELLALYALGAIVFLMRRDWRNSSSATLAIVGPLVLFGVLVSYRNYVRLMVPLDALFIPGAAFFVAKASELRTTRGAPAFAAAIVLVLIARSLPRDMEIVHFRGDGYPKTAAALAERAATIDGPIVFVGQHSLYPYLDAALAERVISVKEPRGKELVASGAFTWLLTDQDPARNQPIAADWAKLASRVEEVLAIDNPMPAPIVFDRLGAAGLAAIAKDREDPAWRWETKLRLFRLRP